MREGTARAKPSASNWSQAIVPLVSVRSTWSTARPISSPATAWPATRWLSISFRVRLRPTLAQRDERPAAGAHVVAARPDQPVVVVLLDDVGAPAGDAADRDHRREEVDRNAERIKEGSRIEVDVRNQPLRGVDAIVELH